MKREADRPEPGEYQQENQIQGEAVEHISTPGDQPVVAIPDQRRTMELPKVNLLDWSADDYVHQDSDIRRTGTERDGMRPVQAGGETEDRLDNTAHDLQRETRFDPAQDNVGPQSD